MFERVLVSMDLSPATQPLMSVAEALPGLGTRRVILAHVVKPIDPSATGSLARQELARDALEPHAERLREKGMHTVVEVVVGSPGTEIVRLARREDPSVILMGSRSRTALREAFLGSTTWEVLRRAHRPVLIYRIEEHDARETPEIQTPGRPKRVIYPTDFSDTAERALHWVEGLAGLGVESFTLVHVLPSEDIEAEKTATERLEGLGERLREAGAREVEIEISVGSPADEILAREGRSSQTMVVMGSHGHGFLPEMVMGSEARQVARRAISPLLIVPAEETE